MYLIHLQRLSPRFLNLLSYISYVLSIKIMMQFLLSSLTHLPGTQETNLGCCRIFIQPKLETWVAKSFLLLSCSSAWGNPSVTCQTTDITAYRTQDRPPRQHSLWVSTVTNMYEGKTVNRNLYLFWNVFRLHVTKQCFNINLWEISPNLPQRAE